MRLTPLADQRLDIIIGGRVLNSCWLLTTMGIAILQMRMLALTWQLSSLALWTACTASAWLLGSLLISSRDPRSQHRAWLWGIAFVTCVLGWVRLSPSIASFASLSAPFRLAVSPDLLMLIALLMGLLSSAWLNQRRPWPPVDERLALVRGLASPIIGLWIAWVFPRFADMLGLICLAPLLVLDCWPEGQCPLPVPGKRLDRWHESLQGVESWQVRMHRQTVPRGWLWSYLAERKRLSLIVFASSLSIVLGSLWSAVPTPFAAAFATLHQLHMLGWLVLSQLVALALGTGCLLLARGVVGTPDRLVPPQWQPYLWFVALCALCLTTASLLALGWPTLQASWSLATSLGVYTLAAATWGIVLPRLQPVLTTVIFVKRHLLFTHGHSEFLKGQRAYERVQEDYARRVLATRESILTALLTPALGWLVDRWSVDGVLICVGLFLLAFLSIWMLGIGFSRLLHWGRLQAGSTNSGDLPWTEAEDHSFIAEASLAPEDSGEVFYEKYGGR